MIGWIAFLLVLPLLVASAVLLAELILGVAPSRRSASVASAVLQTSVVIIPAHDEERSIGATLASIPAGTKTLVVADNCTDATAEIARATGAEVIERVDPDRRGKGYALAFARAHLAPNPPEIVLVLDADTKPISGTLVLLTSRAAQTGRPVQASYFIEPAMDASSIARFSAVAFYIKNVVRQLGLSRLGAPAVLTGSGMAFPWPLFARMPLETGHVTEDLMLGVWCTLEGSVPSFLPEAIVRGESSSDQGTHIQRRRWESGFLATALKYVPRLLSKGVRGFDMRLIWLALHLATPPLLLLLAFDFCALIVLCLFALLSGSFAALGLLASVTAGVVVAVIAAAAGHGIKLTLLDLYSIPTYLVWKIGLSIRTLMKRETSWIRTSRE